MPIQQTMSGPFRIDLERAEVWRGEVTIALRPKAFAVLRCLVDQAGRVVSREQIEQAVWPKTQVGLEALRSCIKQIRHALGDHATQPGFIETVPRRGWRFIAEVASPKPVLSPSTMLRTGGVEGSKARPEQGRRSQSPLPPLSLSPQIPAPRIVGREAEMVQLQTLWAKALQGERQVVFVTGEPGIGKTTLVEAFVHQVEEAAEECFHKAITVARKQKAKSWELRATLSLSRLWQQQGKQKEAKRKLGRIYNWFTEGFDTKDLQEAKTLLAELA